MRYPGINYNSNGCKIKGVGATKKFIELNLFQRIKNIQIFQDYYWYAKFPQASRTTKGQNAREDSTQTWWWGGLELREWISWVGVMPAYRSCGRSLQIALGYNFTLARLYDNFGGKFFKVSWWVGGDLRKGDQWQPGKMGVGACKSHLGIIWHRHVNVTNFRVQKKNLGKKIWEHFLEREFWDPPFLNLNIEIKIKHDVETQHRHWSRNFTTVSPHPARQVKITKFDAVLELLEK